MKNTSSDEIIPADKGLRKKTIILVIGIVLAAMILGPYVNGYLADLRQEGVERPELAYSKMIALMKWVLGSAALLITLTGVYLLVIAFRALKGRALSAAGHEGDQGHPGQNRTAGQNNGLPADL